MSLAWFNDRGIQSKMVAVYAVILLLTGIAGFITILQLSQTTGEFKSSEEYSEAALHSAQLRGAFQLQHQELKNVLIRGGDPEKFEKYHAAFVEQQTEVGSSATS